MSFLCPRCQHRFNLAEATCNRDLVGIIRMQSDFGAHAAVVMEYIGRFEGVHTLKPAKMMRLLTEVREIYTRSGFVFKQRQYKISKEGVAASLRIVCDKNHAVPLTVHNYLKAVMVGIAVEEEKKQSITAERQLYKKEAALRAGTRPGQGPAPRGAADQGPPPKVGDVLGDFKKPWEGKE